MYHKLVDSINKVENLYTQENYDCFFRKQRKTLRCPHCQSRHQLTIHGRYRRHIYLSETIRGVLLVTRMSCPCGKTFVVLPPDIIPFKRYLSRLVVTMIQLHHESSTYLLEKLTGLAKGLLDYWTKQFDAFHRSLAIALDLISLTPESLPVRYAQARPFRRFMQIISADTQPFHDFLATHIV